ncbi:hypothetical protein [Pseudoduganella lutea]|uniref:hypothetical protein n=1 Tax=Pseudoduganella lutea TaxID=321985 RepID=UPI0013EE5BB9|nr:hypothetical protein [Pseudoduganella lutea]
MRRLPAALVSKVPAGVSACSAMVYFACSEGIRNHLAMLWQALHAIVEHLF